MMNPHLSDADLLTLLDADASGEDAPSAHAHLASCAACLARWCALSAADASVRGMHDDEAWAAGIRRERERTRLADRLSTSAPRRDRWFPVTVRNAWAGAGAAVLLLAFAIAALVNVPGGLSMRRNGPAPVAFDVEPGALPLRHLTPGATMTVRAAELCRAMPVEPAPISEEIRAAVLRAYGMEHLLDHEYELDYLVTPDLGGAPEPRNLWPEPYGARVWNARVKDELESLLPQLVCEGKVDLATAQHDIASNWIAAYKKYFNTDRPVRLSSRAVAPAPADARP